ncbi:alpha/beta fold hydrolase [Streptomyces albipurpureus]|uniref:Alpha/beta hydrolase n=1 Tax=Streptomyces albipurpureus TaxID=2897419 RepID=A0ABT0UYU1_9ACTN|nr:alpha/beta hydrolase [Streptomyces sp. CWNU-1]MCM2393739.1 alpha/beta hydrolase [Streptomyces sp. CWNU-1]
MTGTHTRGPGTPGPRPGEPDAAAPRDSRPYGLTVLTSRRGLRYQSRGEGPVLLLVHGWCLDRRMWMYQEAALAASFTVVSVDLAGFGGSAGLLGPYSAARHAADLADLLTELGARSATVVAFAYGATVAMELATAFPERAGRLVLIGVPSAATAPYEKMPRAMLRDWPDFAARSARAICADGVSDATVDWLTRMFAGTPLPVALEAVGQLARWEPLPMAAAVTVPTLVVHGANDRVVPLGVAAGLAEALPDAALATVAESAHLVPVDASEQLNRLVDGFARETP